MDRKDIIKKQDRTAFFVEPNDCVTCGCCQAEAPTVFSWLEYKGTIGAVSGDEVDLTTSNVHKQPENQEELTATIFALEHCMVGAIFYGGDNSEITGRLGVSANQPNQHDPKPRSKP